MVGGHLCVLLCAFQSGLLILTAKELYASCGTTLIFLLSKSSLNGGLCHFHLCLCRLFVISLDFLHSCHIVSVINW